MTGCPRAAPILSDRSRAMMSGGPPAGVGITSLTGRSGKACALCKTNNGAINRARAPKIFSFIFSRLLFELVGHLGDGGLGAIVIALLAAGGPADADGPDGFVAHIDRHAAAERDHLGEIALRL